MKRRKLISVLLTATMMATMFAGCGSENKAVYKIIQIMIADFLRDLNYLLVRMQKQIRRPLHSVIIQIIFERLAIFLAEQLPQICTIDIIFLTQTL